MKFKDFSQYLQRLEQTPLRNKMTEILAQLFKKCSGEEIDKACYLALGRLAPKYEGVEFNMAEKMMIKALAMAVGQNPDQVQKLYKKIGDLGEIVTKFKNSQTSKLTIRQIYDSLRQIAEDEGEGSVDRKINKMAQLLQKVDWLSAKYIARIPVNKLRLGFSDMTILDALSWMKTGDKSLRPQLERAFNVLADIGKIAQTFKNKGIVGIKQIKSEVGVPIRAALAERLRSADKILEKMTGKCALEPKYDGFRCQLHLDKSRPFKLTKEDNLSLFAEKSQHFVRIFSRNLDNTTQMFPDLVAAAQHLKAKSVILDGEAIAFNPKTGKFLPFQETVQRKRKHGVDQKAKEMPLKIFVFDILDLNGQSLLQKPFSQRRKILEKLLTQSQGEEEVMILTRQKIVSQTKEFDQFFKTVVSEELEGLMAKKLDAVYQAGARNFNWVKYKIAMQSELADTIDCVVMGYYRGKGKRTTFGIGAFLAGILDKKNHQILSVSKIGTGLTDEQWRQMKKKCGSLEIKKKPQPYFLDKNLAPDVWCQPGLVVEIEADMVTKSPIHSAGLALRFPRLKRFRDDKSVDQATSLQELSKLAKM